MVIYWNLYRYISFLAGGDWNMTGWCFHDDWEWTNHPNWRTHIFLRVGSTTKQLVFTCIYYKKWIFLSAVSWCFLGQKPHLAPVQKKHREFWPQSCVVPPSTGTAVGNSVSGLDGLHSVDGVQTSFVKKGEITNEIHRGCFDTMLRDVVDLLLSSHGCCNHDIWSRLHPFWCVCAYVSMCIYTVYVDSV